MTPSFSSRIPRWAVWAASSYLAVVVSAGSLALGQVPGAAPGVYVGPRPSGPAFVPPSVSAPAAQPAAEGAGNVAAPDKTSSPTDGGDSAAANLSKRLADVEKFIQGEQTRRQAEEAKKRQTAEADADAHLAPEDAGGSRSPGQLIDQPRTSSGDQLTPPRAGAAFRSPGALIDANPKGETFPTFRITGFTQLDTGYYSQSPDNKALVGDGQDGTGFRRARLAVVGKAAELTSYYFEVDFAAAGRPSFFDMWVEQANIPCLGDVRVGQYAQPFSADAMSGFRNLMFLERSLPFLAFVPFRRVGIQSSNGTEDEMTYWAYSVFRTGGFQNAPLGDDRYATDIGDVGGYSFSARITHLLFDDRSADDRYLWQIGASYDYSRLGADDAVGSSTAVPFYQAKTTPEFGPLGYPDISQNFGSSVASTPVFVDTGKYAANDFHLLGAEMLCQWGAFSAQAEYMCTIVDSVVAGPIFYEGAYLQAACRLTGEHRQFDRRLGALRNPTPAADFRPLRGDGIAGWGAWEIAARWSFVDLRNPAALNGHYLAGTNGTGAGVLNDSTVGVSWFLNQHTKVQFNWIHAMLENTGAPANLRGFSSADLFVSRVQVDF